MSTLTAFRTIFICGELNEAKHSDTCLFMGGKASKPWTGKSLSIGLGRDACGGISGNRKDKSSMNTIVAQPSKYEGVRRESHSAFLSLTRDYARVANSG